MRWHMSVMSALELLRQEGDKLKACLCARRDPASPLSLPKSKQDAMDRDRGQHLSCYESFIKNYYIFLMQTKYIHLHMQNFKQYLKIKKC